MSLYVSPESFNQQLERKFNPTIDIEIKNWESVKSIFLNIKNAEINNTNKRNEIQYRNNVKLFLEKEVSFFNKGAAVGFSVTACALQALGILAAGPIVVSLALGSLAMGQVFCSARRLLTDSNVIPIKKVITKDDPDLEIQLGSLGLNVALRNMQVTDPSLTNFLTHCVLHPNQDLLNSGDVNGFIQLAEKKLTKLILIQKSMIFNNNKLPPEVNKIVLGNLNSLMTPNEG